MGSYDIVRRPWIHRRGESLTSLGHASFTWPSYFQAIAIARGAGLSIPDSAITYVEETTLREHAESHPERATFPVSSQKFKPSMLVDLEAGRPMEIEGIVGGVVRKGREAGFHAPRCGSVLFSGVLVSADFVPGWNRHMQHC